MNARVLIYFSLRLSVLASVALIASCGHTHHNHAKPVVADLGLKNLRQPRPFILASGQPTKEQLSTLSKEGVKHIVNLRPASELDWDESAHVRSLGMHYTSIPVSGAADLTKENALLLDRTLGDIGTKPALVHCSSGNRVGALIAIRESTVRGKSTSKSIRKGKKWGLTTLEPDVRKALSAH